MPYETLNPVFDFYTRADEQAFYADFVDESIFIEGTECLYIPKDYDVDSILGEPYQAIHNRFYRIAVRLTTPLGYEETPDIMSQFGLTIKAGTNWVMSKRVFRQMQIPDRELRPLEGDLLLVGPYASTPQDPVMSNHLFEMTHVAKDAPFWPLGRYYVWAIRCQLYTRASGEKFDTGNSHIDDINNRDPFKNADNDGFDNKVDELLDFTEDNPFGDL